MWLTLEAGLRLVVPLLLLPPAGTPDNPRGDRRSCRVRRRYARQPAHARSAFPTGLCLKPASCYYDSSQSPTAYSLRACFEPSGVRGLKLTRRLASLGVDAGVQAEPKAEPALLPRLVWSMSTTTDRCGTADLRLVPFRDCLLVHSDRSGQTGLVRVKFFRGPVLNLTKSPTPTSRSACGACGPLFQRPSRVTLSSPELAAPLASNTGVYQLSNCGSGRPRSGSGPNSHRSPGPRPERRGGRAGLGPCRPCRCWSRRRS